MKKRTHPILLVIIALLAILLFSCGNAGAPTGSSTQPSAVDGTPAEQSDVPGNMVEAGNDTKKVLAVSEEAGVELFLQNGIVQLKLPEYLFWPENNQRYGVRSLGLSYGSEEEMVEAIYGLRFENEHYIYFSHMEQTQDCCVRFQDPTAVKVAVLPDGISSREIAFHGDSYSTNFTDDSGIGGRFVPLRGTVDFEELLEKNVLRFWDFPGSTITNMQTKETVVGGYAGTEYNYRSSTAKLKTITFEIPVSGGTIYVREDYKIETLDSAAASIPDSEIVPMSVTVLGNTEEGCFRVDLSTSHKIDPAWYAGFGLKPLTK